MKLKIDIFLNNECFQNGRLRDEFVGMVTDERLVSWLVSHPAVRSINLRDSSENTVVTASVEKE